jgi:hypothetical protein
MSEYHTAYPLFIRSLDLAPLLKAVEEELKNEDNYDAVESAYEFTCNKKIDQLTKTMMDSDPNLKVGDLIIKEIVEGYRVKLEEFVKIIDSSDVDVVAFPHASLYTASGDGDYPTNAMRVFESLFFDYDGYFHPYSSVLESALTVNFREYPNSEGKLLIEVYQK